MCEAIAIPAPVPPPQDSDGDNSDGEDSDGENVDKLSNVVANFAAEIVDQNFSTAPNKEAIVIEMLTKILQARHDQTTQEKLNVLQSSQDQTNEVTEPEKNSQTSSTAALETIDEPQVPIDSGENIEDKNEECPMIENFQQYVEGLYNAQCYWRTRPRS